MTLEVTKDTWIVADTHFGHSNIILYQNRPPNHDDIMRRRWKRLVKKDDVVLHLGDLCIWYANRDYWFKECKKLPGDKYIIWGNHDKGQKLTKETFERVTGFKIIEPFRQNEVFFSHEQTTDEELWYVNIHGHSHNHAPFGFYSYAGTNYYNASIEGMDYKPWRLGDILKQCV